MLMAIEVKIDEMNEDADIQVAERMEFDKVQTDYVFVEEVKDKMGKLIYKNWYKQAEGFVIYFQEIMVSEPELQQFLQEPEE
jgi:hypothetical protein